MLACRRTNKACFQWKSNDCVQMANKMVLFFFGNLLINPAYTRSQRRHECDDKCKAVGCNIIDGRTIDISLKSFIVSYADVE
jgi:hypothetical protein